LKALAGRNWIVQKTDISINDQRRPLIYCPDLDPTAVTLQTKTPQGIMRWGVGSLDIQQSQRVLCPKTAC
jgi:hypothetical protein